MANFYTDNQDLKFHLNHPLMERIIGLKERNYADKDKYDYAPSDFEDAIDSYDKVMEIMGEVCADVLAPNAEQNDRNGHSIENDHLKYNEQTLQNREALRKAGLWGITLPRRYNGLNLSNVGYMLAAEMIARADGGFCNFYGLQDCAETLYEFASEELKQEYLPQTAEDRSYAMVLTEPDAGSDLQSVQLKATFDEKSGKWLLNGVKRFITNGDADIQLVLARSEEGTRDGRGLSLFVYDKDKNCQIVRRIEDKIGIHGSPTCELVYKDAPARLVGMRKMGLIKYVMSLMYCARLGVGAQSVGISEEAYRQALKYANEREQFGKAIIKFPAVYQMLANMRARVKGMRTLLYETARFVDMSKLLAEIQNNKERALTPEEKTDAKAFKKLADAFTPLLKLFASENCNSICYDSLQIHGGSGYMRDFAIERLTRDARITTIYEGTTQLQVVAAIKAVTTGVFTEQIYWYDNILKDAENLKEERAKLQQMTAEYEAAIRTVEQYKDAEYIDFQARNLVELAGNIIVSYLLFTDSMRDEQYLTDAKVFFKMAQAENRQKIDYINNSNPEDLKMFR